MNRLLKILIISFLTLFLCGGTAMALTLGDEITIYDGNGPNTGEDGETEPGMINNQSWDLEGFFLNGTTLTMVGGYDFANGNSEYTSGDIFIDVDGVPVYGDIDRGGANGTTTVSNSYGYDYVLDLDFAAGTYSVFAIDETAQLETAHYTQNEGSSPWQYVDDGTELVAYRDSRFGYFSGLGDGEVGGLLGGYHNAVSVDLSFLTDLEFYAHFTMECGNDNLMGRATVPEPATMLLLGTGLIGLAGIGRKRFKK